ncbi:YiaA/YiaB family inner membrane protein [Pseudonocardia phyllosphaerae]|uniref:YiaA/YiaB family inner membrane protein n=1 Tax=Pseudonocardia phyllosphaerae TaxID=3390502 RepID=UPI003979A5E7
MTASQNTPNTTPATTAAFHMQAMVSFGVSLAAVVVGTLYLPVDAWVKAFLAIAVLYAITSAFTLAKCVRDRQESLTVVNRVDQARMDKLLAEHDPFRAVA